MTDAAARRRGWGAFGIAWAVAGALLACVGPVGGVGEGSPCSGDDCASNLTCQPIPGRSVDYCCPTPASMSSKANCQPATGAGDGG